MTRIETRKAEIYTIVQAILWSFAPIVGALSLKSLPPILALAGMTGFALIFFLGVALYRGSLLRLRFEKGLGEAVIAAVLLAINFSLIFVGLQYTSAGNAGIIGGLEFFFSILFFNLFRGEHLSRRDFIGGLLMVGGASLVFIPEVIEHASINKGDALILLANVCAPLINFFQRKARQTAKSEVILVVRGLIGLPVTCAIAFLLGERASLSQFVEILPLLIFSGFFVFGLVKILWIEAIHRIPVAKANALSSIAPVATVVFAYVVLGQHPTGFQLLSLIPLFIGGLILAVNRKASEASA